MFFFFVRVRLSARTCDPLLRHQEGVGALLGVGVQRGPFAPVQTRLLGPPGFPGAPALTSSPDGKAEQSAQAPDLALHRCWLVDAEGSAGLQEGRIVRDTSLKF